MKHDRISRILAVFMLLSVWLLGLSGTPVMAGPEINLSPDSGAVGTTVTISGENWDSFKGDEIYIYFSGEEISASPIVVPQTGAFQFDFNIPGDAEPGEHAIRVRTDLGSTLVRSTFTVLEPEISLSRKSGPVGSKLVVDGEGFYADKVVTVYYDTKIIGTLTASSTGEFSYSFNIPNSAAGEHKITAKNAEGNAFEVKFTVMPRITLNPDTGAVGSILKVGGTGFASKSDISVFFRSDEVAFAKTDESGTFGIASFNVPSASPGTYDIRVKDEKGNTVRYEFTITAGVSIDQATASVGSELTISGTGFEVGGEIVVEYDGMAVTTIAADNDGAFQVVFKVPPGPHGEHVISVSDGVNTRQLVFEIESDAPPVPAPVAPGDKSVVRAATYFDWEDVDDPSVPVRYQLQIASDVNFAVVVMEKTLVESTYTLGETEALAAVTAGSPYYWRVKAIDGAANESGWSAPRLLLVLAPKAPALLLPESDSKAEAEAYFDWEDVASLSSSVTYHIQVASVENFTELIMEKEGLADSEYTVAKGEKLAAVKKDAPYYWRVRAIDDAGNEGEWSAPGSFVVGFYLALPSWALYTLIAFGAIIVGFLAFWLGRRTAFSE
ncbi:MAG: IPT/TIG domain-containing protein [Dehalococcoidales bacterium]